MAVIHILAMTVFSVSVISSVSGAGPSNYLLSPPDTDWGIWGGTQSCPFGRVAQGFQLKTERNLYSGDDTALNGIRLFCGHPASSNTARITSTVGEFGEWGEVFSCYPGNLTGLQLRVEGNLNGGDDTATNNVRFLCNQHNGFRYDIEGDGESWGTWRTPLRCFQGQAICSIRTQVEPNLGRGDDTSLNRVRMGCCNLPGRTKAAEAVEPEILE